MLPECEIILNRTAQQATFRIQVSQMPVDIVPRWIEFQGFLEGRDRLECGPFSPEGIGRL